LRLFTGDIELFDAIHKAVAFDESGIVALDGEALALDISPEDLGRNFLTHAFMDGHCHPLFAGREQLGPDVTGAKNVDEILAIVSSWLQTHPTPLWAVGGAYDRSLVAGGVFLAQWLDEISGDRPVVLHASDHHTLWANSAAMRLAGVSEAAPPVVGGSIDVDEFGKPTGVFRETEAKELVTDAIPPLSVENELEALSWAQGELARLGITAAQDAWMDKGMVEVYLEASRRRQLLVRTNLAFWIRPESWREDSKKFVEQRSQVNGLEDQFLSANTAKFFADGVFGSATASVKLPYASDSANRGEPVWTAQELNSATKHFASLGFQLHIHAIGDAGVCAALDAIEFSGSPANSVIAHTELVAEEDIPRFGRLGVVANFEPLWAREDGMLTSCVHHLGRERIDSMYRMRDFIDSGAKISFGSDWPVSSPDPLLGLFTATHRALPETPNISWTPSQRISLKEALRAYTVAVSEQLGLAANSADFVVLSGNPHGADLLELRVVETIVAARTTYKTA